MAVLVALLFQITWDWLCVRSGTRPLGSVGRAVTVLFYY